MTTPTDGREAILSRIREALKTPAPRAHGHTPRVDASGVQTPTVNLAQVPPSLDPTLDIEAKDLAPIEDDATANVSEQNALEQNAVENGATDSSGATSSTRSSSTPIQLTVLNNVSANEPHDAREWMPRVGESAQEQIALFAERSAELKTEFIVCASRDELEAKLRELKTINSWTKLATYTHELCDMAVRVLDLPTMKTDDGYAIPDLESCDVGITNCEALIAQTGSVLVTNNNGGRALSVLPPHHVVIATRDQMLPDLTAAFQLLESRYGAAYPSMMGFITGPSRTGDIERILVLGAHGPKKLTILLID